MPADPITAHAMATAAQPRADAANAAWSRLIGVPTETCSRMAIAKIAIAPPNNFANFVLVIAREASGNDVHRAMTKIHSKSCRFVRIRESNAVDGNEAEAALGLPKVNFRA